MTEADGRIHRDDNDEARSELWVERGSSALKKTILTADFHETFRGERIIIFSFRQLAAVCFQVSNSWKELYRQINS